MTKEERAKEFGAAVAKEFHEMFTKHPEYRGAQFVYPDTLRIMLVRHVKTQAWMACLSRWEDLALRSAQETLEDILEAEKRCGAKGT